MTVAIIGGGFTGAAVALHLAGNNDSDIRLRIVVVEPRPSLGQGLAYATEDPAHRINVPAGKMTIFPERSDDFQTYIDAVGEAHTDSKLLGRDGLPYPRRSTFGRYVADRLSPLLQAGAVEHWQTTVESVSGDTAPYRLSGADGQEILADFLVIAVSHPAPALTSVLEPFRADSKLIADVTVPHALRPILPDDRVLIVGNGLTSADVVASLELVGHRGAITSISRRGLRSRGHGPAGQEAFGDFLTHPAPTASRLLQSVRRTIREAAAQGSTWHSVLDALRSQGQALWAGLSIAERRRIARHVRPFWDVHRFRIAPQVEDVIDRASADGRLDILAASVSAVERSVLGYRVKLRERHRKEGRTITVDAIVVTTGPAHGSILQSQPLLRDLESRGILTACPTGLGIACDRNANPLSGDGEPVTDILIAGPLARGTFGELMGLPQVTEHAVFVAGRIANLLAERSDPGCSLPKAG